MTACIKLPSTANSWDFSLKRATGTPIMLPDINNNWECENVFNPSVIYHHGIFHMHYRAQGTDWISRIGYAVSTDGINWNRMKEPVLSPMSKFDSKGVEDPRVCMIGDTFYMTYCGNAPYSGKGTEYAGSIYPMIARSKNMINWELVGPLAEGEDNKDHFLFPEKINNKFCAIHRRRPDIWIAYSDDLKDWPEKDMKPVCRSRNDADWEGQYIGGNGVPIKTSEGWIMFYHGADEEGVYRIGVMLLDLEDPSRIISRPKAPVLWPQEAWEMRGDVPNVVFSNANILVDKTVYVFYGGADHVIGLATIGLEDLMKFIKECD